MILAKIRVNGVRATPYEVRDIPMGIIGGQVLFEYTDPMWAGLTKTVVFQGTVTKDVVDAGELVTIPQEVVARAGAPLRVGVYGTDAENNIAIPTIWSDTDLGRVRAAADPSGDESTDPQLPVWAQLQEQIKELKENGIGGGLTAEQITALDGMFKVCAFTKADVSTEYSAFKTAFGITDSGEDSGGEEEPDTPVVTACTISAELVNVTSSNSATSVNEGASYTATLTASDGYTLDGASVTVTMGGTDITSTAYADGVISIASVTGNVEIIASAVQVEEVEAALVTDGLVDFFDMRTAEYNNTASGGATTIASTQGNGQLFAWANNCVSAQNEYGISPANSRSWPYDKDGGTTQSELGTEFTVVFLSHGAVPAFGFMSSNVGARWVFLPAYVNTSGSTVNATAKAGSDFNGDTKADYNFCVVRVDGAIMTEIMDTSRTEYDGAEITSFVKWSDKIAGSLYQQASGDTVTAIAIYNRALTDIEIEEIRAYFKTMEVA